MPTISLTIARSNLAPSPPLGPVESHIPNRSAVGQSSNRAVAFWVDTREECLRAADIFVDNDVYIEAAPSKHAVAAGFFLYAYEPGGNRIEVTTGGYFVYDPDYEPVVWTAQERARGQFWGVKTIDSFHTYGTPDVSAQR